MRALIDLVRETRLWWSATDCGGISWPLLALVVIAAWWIGLLIGFSLGALAFSPGCRRLLIFVLQTAITVLGPAAGALVPDRGLVRTRLAGYRG